MEELTVWHKVGVHIREAEAAMNSATGLVNALPDGPEKDAFVSELRTVQNHLLRLHVAKVMGIRQEERK